jgi:hypothetical protein
MFREEKGEYRCCEWRRGEGGKKDDIKAYQPKYFKMAIKKFKIVRLRTAVLSTLALDNEVCVVTQVPCPKAWPSHFLED